MRQTDDTYTELFADNLPPCLLTLQHEKKT